MHFSRMNSLTVPALLFFSLLIFSCSDKGTAGIEVAELEEEVMYIHDDVMPKMSDIMKHKEKINALLSDSSWHETNQEYVNNLRRTLDKLNVAEKEMWNWMHNYSDVFGQLQSDQQKTDFLLKEKEKISEVRVLMLESIEQAEAELTNSPI